MLKCTVGHSCLLKARFTPNCHNCTIHTFKCMASLKSRTISGVALVTHLHRARHKVRWTALWSSVVCASGWFVDLELCDRSGWCLKLDSHLRISAANIRQTQIFSTAWSKHGSFWMRTVFKGPLHTFWMTVCLAFLDQSESFGFGHTDGITAPEL